MKTIDLSSVPVDSAGRKIWKLSIGCKLPFEYEDIIGEIEIVGYTSDGKNSKLECKYKDRTHSFIPKDIIACRINPLISETPIQYIEYEVGLTIEGNGVKFELLRYIPISESGLKNPKWEIKCLNCGHVREVCQYHLKEIKSCTVCSKNKGTLQVVKGINDITTTDPWMIPYFQGGEEEASKYTSQSNVFLNFICPTCGKIIEKKYRINHLHNHGKVQCENCKKYSFGEMMMNCILKQSKWNFVKETTKSILPWSELKRYDFYIPELKCIIEIHGLQHYKEDNFFNSGYRQEQDIYKKELALQNGIEHYFEIDTSSGDIGIVMKLCRESGVFELLEMDEEKILFNDLKIEDAEEIAKEIKKIIAKYPSISLKDMYSKLPMHRSPQYIKNVMKKYNIQHTGYIRPIKVFDNGELIAEYPSFKAFLQEANNEPYYMSSRLKMADLCKNKESFKDRYTYEYYK